VVAKATEDYVRDNPWKALESLQPLASSFASWPDAAEPFYGLSSAGSRLRPPWSAGGWRSEHWKGAGHPHIYSNRDDSHPEAVRCA